MKQNFNKTQNYILRNRADGEEAENAGTNVETPETALEQLTNFVDLLLGDRDSNRPKVAGFKINNTFISLESILLVFLLIAAVVVIRKMN